MVVKLGESKIIAGWNCVHAGNQSLIYKHRFNIKDQICRYSFVRGIRISNFPKNKFRLYEATIWFIEKSDINKNTNVE